MSIVDLKPRLDPPVRVCESLIALAQGVGMVAADVVRLDLAASARTEIADSLVNAASAIHQAAKAMDSAYRHQVIVTESQP